MKLRNHLRSLYRSPLKTGLTLLLLAAAAFLFLYNLSEYSVSHREYREARDRYEGVLTVEESEVAELVDARYNFFLLTDETNPGRTWDRFSYEEYHHESLSPDTAEALSALPYISRTERRYMTAGVSGEYMRLDTDPNFFAYNSRLILEATLAGKRSLVYLSDPLGNYDAAASRELDLEDVELLAGDPEQLEVLDKTKITLAVLKEERRDAYAFAAQGGGYTSRFASVALDLDLHREDCEALEPGHRYVFVLRGVNPWMDEQFLCGDDTRIGWWPYITDVTDLPENWLETEEFAPLRELIRVTEDDLHTFDVVYGDDMAAIPRVAEGRIICREGRFLTPADGDKPCCVVSTDLLETYGLAVGDTLTLDLGNYLCEQYAPLGAVASARGRYSTEFRRQTFTIVGAYLDLNEGKHVNRDLYWCWSNNAVFVPSAFLPECVNADSYTPKPAELSFVVGSAEDILPFMEECLPQVEAMGLAYTFSDGGWLQVGEDLLRARSLALTKLLIFSGAALFALVLTVWLFIGRKKKEYGVLRSLGMGKGEASNRLFVPFLLLGVLAALLGLVVARIVTARQLAASGTGYAAASLGLFLLGALGFLALLAVLAYIGLLLIRKKSILELIQEKK